MNKLQSSRWTPRTVFLGVFIACAALIAYALYLQHVDALEPCPMCILQRYAFIAIGAVALIAALHNPRGVVLSVYSGLIVLLAVAGGGVAARHAWLQHFPTKSFSCGADLGYLLNTFPLAKALPAIFTGTGECSDVQWKFLGISIPEWAFLWFFAFAVVAVIALVKLRERR
ncbi:MAG: disulfide bond formation protein B [Sulfurifustis sp.]